MLLLSQNTPQFKANLHCHSTRSDGRLTPEELKTAYKEHGYHILAITDHESPKNHSELNDSDFLMLTGYEAYIRNNPECRYDVFSPEIHLNLFAKAPENETLIGYNAACCKYLSADEQAALSKAGPTCLREYTPQYINAFIQAANDNGYLVAYNHPVWSMESQERIEQYDGIFSMEMINYNSYLINHTEYNGALYDHLLCSGKRWFVHAADDNHNQYPFEHPQSDSFGAFTMICAPSLSYDDVIDAMENGQMYSSNGPTFEEIAFDGETLHLQCSPASTVICHIGSKHPPAVYAPTGETVTSVDIPIHPQARYIRISIIDADGRRADTRGFSRDELGLSPLPTP